MHVLMRERGRKAGGRVSGAPGEDGGHESIFKVERGLRGGDFLFSISWDGVDVFSLFLGVDKFFSPSLEF